VAEESGLIVPMGEWVMRESCMALARWQHMDPDKAPRVVSVNVSRAELAQGQRLLNTVREALEAAQLPPQSLQLEVTEREVMRDPEASLVHQRQRGFGVAHHFALGDFQLQAFRRQARGFERVPALHHLQGTGGGQHPTQGEERPPTRLRGAHGHSPERSRFTSSHWRASCSRARLSSSRIGMATGRPQNWVRARRNGDRGSNMRPPDR